MSVVVVAAAAAASEILKEVYAYIAPSCLLLPAG